MKEKIKFILSRLGVHLFLRHDFYIWQNCYSWRSPSDRTSHRVVSSKFRSQFPTRPAIKTFYSQLLERRISARHPIFLWKFHKAPLFQLSLIAGDCVISCSMKKANGVRESRKALIIFFVSFTMGLNSEVEVRDCMARFLAQECRQRSSRSDMFSASYRNILRRVCCIPNDAKSTVIDAV